MKGLSSKEPSRKSQKLFPRLTRRLSVCVGGVWGGLGGGDGYSYTSAMSMMV